MAQPPPIAKGLLLALAVVLGGCGSKDAANEANAYDIAEAATSGEAMAMVTPTPPPPPKVPIPREFIGNWKLASIECEADSDEKPPKHLPRASLSIREEGTWSMDVEYFPMYGEIEVHPSRDRVEIRLKPSALDFEMVDGRLENWSEGDAPYMCGRIFERDRN